MVPITPELAAMAKPAYVLLTTFRRTGEPVSTPVWIAQSGDALLVTTDPQSGKVKRLRNNPAVELTPCDVRGRVTPGAPTIQASAEVRTDTETNAAMDAAFINKYGIQFRAIRGLGKLRRTPPSQTVLRITDRD
ncbi:PPOX class F420-dependent oxidoreductase [Salinibacterium hongtaonis]|nr:PPOX class F420-dependent oxidoreductase [Salinibacterium hongtaonis]